MIPRTRPVAYDAVEAPRHVLFALDAPLLRGGLSYVSFVQGHGVEVLSRCGVRIRFGNLHPRLAEACRTKPVLVATMEGDGASVTTTERHQSTILPDDWFPEGFLWYLDAASDPAEIAARPMPRLIAVVRPGVVAAISGVPDAGAPLGLCRRSTRLMGLPRTRLWTMIQPGLNVDQSLLSGGTPANPVDSDIEGSVASAFEGRSSPREVPVASWRSQLAIVLRP